MIDAVHEGDEKRTDDYSLRSVDFLNMFLHTDGAEFQENRKYYNFNNGPDCVRALNIKDATKRTTVADDAFHTYCVGSELCQAYAEKDASGKYHAETADFAKINAKIARLQNLKEKDDWETRKKALWELFELYAREDMCECEGTAGVASCTCARWESCKENFFSVQCLGDALERRLVDS